MVSQSDPHFKAWECTGCGRIESPKPCLGICQDRAVELIHSEAYRQLEQDNAKMRELILRLARTHPLDGQWERSYRILQARAIELLETLEPHEPPAAVPE